ncbi:hypothetical protein XENTR_v10012575 [Xenopus tropicalis]|nr:hypothetical protein XENTR_v10012575 [Xenopus tropicalis]
MNFLWERKQDIILPIWPALNSYIRYPWKAVRRPEVDDPSLLHAPIGMVALYGVLIGKLLERPDISTLCYIIKVQSFLTASDFTHYTTG